MLTYRLTGTTEAIGIDHDEPDQSPPRQQCQQEQPRPIFAHHGAPRRRRRAADLQMWLYQRECSPTPATHESFCSTRPSASLAPPIYTTSGGRVGGYFSTDNRDIYG